MRQWVGSMLADRGSEAVTGALAFTLTPYMLRSLRFYSDPMGAGFYSDPMD